MALIKNVKRYFVASHTGKGFVNFLNSNVNGMKVILVSHPSLTVKTKIFQQLVKSLSKGDEEIELLQNGHSQRFLDGLIIREKSLAVIGDHIATDGLEILNVFDFDQSINMTEQEGIMSDIIHKAYQYLADSLAAHEAVEKFYIQSMNFDRSNELIDRVQKELFAGKERVDAKQGVIYQRLFDSNSLYESVELVPELLHSVNQRYFIQGGPGTGKSVFMREMLNTCLRLGYNVEQYMCSFDPNSTDMIIIRDLDICMLDSSGPHEFSPLSAEDRVYDLYKTAGTFDVEKRYEQEISRLQSQQQVARRKANILFEKAGQQLQKIESLISEHVSDSTIEQKSLTILQEFR